MTNTEFQELRAAIRANDVQVIGLHCAQNRSSERTGRLEDRIGELEETVQMLLSLVLAER